MNFHKLIIKLVCATLILALPGCEKFQLGQPQQKTEVLSNVIPLAMWKMGPNPTESTFRSVIAQSKRQPLYVREMQILNSLPGRDQQRVAGGFLFGSEEGIPEFVFFVPVVDYANFLDQLDEHFPLKRAVAGRTKIGQLTFVVKQVGRYAAFGSSIDGINTGSTLPQTFLKNRPHKDAYSFMLRPQLFAKLEKRSLEESLTELLGESVAAMIRCSEKIDIDVSFDGKQDVELEVVFESVSSEGEHYFHELKSSMDNQEASNMEMPADQKFSLTFKVARNEFRLTKDLIEPSLLSVFEPRLSYLSRRASKQTSFGLPRIMQNEGSYLPTGSTCGGGGSRGGRRRG